MNIILLEIKIPKNFKFLIYNLKCYILIFYLNKLYHLGNF